MLFDLNALFPPAAVQHPGEKGGCSRAEPNPQALQGQESMWRMHFVHLQSLSRT